MHDQASHERTARLTGIALMCAAVACFALLDTTAKYLSLSMSTLQIVWARYTGAFLFPFIVSNPWTRPGLTRTTRPLLQIGRSMLLLGSTLCNFAALRYLQLDEAVALVFSTPFFVAALSWPMLGERVRWRRWSAVAVGFIGVLVIALMVASGAMGSGGHYLLIAAHRLAPAAVLSPFIYTEIVLVIALGFIVFGDVPNRFTITGAAIVVASGLYLLHRETVIRRKA